MARKTVFTRHIQPLGVLVFSFFVSTPAAFAEPTKPAPPTSALPPVSTSIAPFWSGPRIAGAMFTGYGLIAIVLGSVYAARSDAASSQLPQHCLSSDIDQCDEIGYALRLRASSDGRLGVTALGFGAASVFAGLTLAWINPGQAAPSPSSPSRVTALRFAPLALPGARGIAVAGSF